MRVNGQIMIPSDATADDVSTNGDIPEPSGDFEPAAAAPGPAPANITIPALLSPDVNATWHWVDSPPGATCEVGQTTSATMVHLIEGHVIACGK